MINKIDPVFEDAVTRAEAPRETSDPFEILSRRELALGINLHGQTCDIDLTIRIELRIDLSE